MRYEFSEPQMGVPFRIVLFAPAEETARTAARAAFDRIQQLNGVLSDYEFDSELSRLSRTSGTDQWVPVSDDLWRVLVRAQELSRRSNGAFDVTIGPAVNLWRKARREKRLPEPRLLDETRRLVGFENLQLDSTRRAALLVKPGMRIDLGGIAKGYAVDEAMKVLRAHQIRIMLVGGDGDIAVGDAPPEKPGWSIGVASLDVPGAVTNQVILLTNSAVSTSGDTSQRLEIDGRRYSHILDPRTGIGLTDHSLVTIIARDSITADTLATTVGILGPQRGFELVRSTPGVEALLTRRPADRVERVATPGFERLLRRSRAQLHESSNRP
jgi:thiamine biosynthesis lipoprotein